MMSKGIVQHDKIDHGTTGHDALDVQLPELRHVGVVSSDLQGGTAASYYTITLGSLPCPSSIL